MPDHGARGGGYSARGGGYSARGGGYSARGGGYSARGGGCAACGGGGCQACGGGCQACGGGGCQACGGGCSACGGGYSARGGTGGHSARGGAGGYSARGGGCSYQAPPLHWGEGSSTRGAAGGGGYSAREGAAYLAHDGPGGPALEGGGCAACGGGGRCAACGGLGSLGGAAAKSPLAPWLLLAAVAVHSAYLVAVSAIYLAYAAGRSRATYSRAVLASTVLVGLAQVATAAFPAIIERAVGATKNAGLWGDVRFFGAIALAKAALAFVPAVAAEATLEARSSSGGGLAAALLLGAAFALGGALWAAARGVFVAAAARAVSSGSWRRWALAAVLAAAFAAIEVVNALAFRAYETDLLTYEPGEEVRPLARPELVAKVKELCARIGMPDAADRVMVDHSFEGLNAFAMRRVIVLSKSTAELEDADHAVAIVAHELAHVRLRHASKSFVMASATSAGRFALLYLCITMPGAAAGFLTSAIPLASASRAAGLLHHLVLPVFDEASFLAAMAYSRASELDADRFAYDAVGNKFVEALLLLEKASPGLGAPWDNLLAHRWSHPPIPRRVENLAGK